MPNQSGVDDAKPRTFESVLSREAFAGLKAILDTLTRNREAPCEGVHETNTFEHLLARLGCRVNRIHQIHVQDAHSRLGSTGGIKTLLPYHDIPTKSSMPTLVNFDSTATATPQSVGFFNKMLAAFKTQLDA